MDVGPWSHFKQLLAIGQSLVYVVSIGPSSSISLPLLLRKNIFKLGGKGGVAFLHSARLQADDSEAIVS